MSTNKLSAAKHLGSILENVNVSHPVNTLTIQESSLNLAKHLVIALQESKDQSTEKLRSAEVPESRVGYTEPTDNGDKDITLDDNGGYVGNGKDTYYHSDKGKNSNTDSSDNLTGSSQNYVESSTGKEAAGIAPIKQGEIQESGMGAGDLPDYEAMTRTGGSTTTHDEPDEKLMKKIGAKAPNIEDHRNMKSPLNKPVSNPRADASKAIAAIFKKVN